MSAGSRAIRKRDITVTIPHDEGAMQIDGMLSGRTFQHSGVRLTTLTAIGRSVRAIVYGVKTSSGSL